VAYTQSLMIRKIWSLRQHHKGAEEALWIL